MASPYGWLITKDHLAEEFGEGDGRKGVAGPRGLSAEMLERLKGTHGYTFTMYDDDGVKVYTGKYLGPIDYVMGPLDDFGMPDAGCTEIRYPGKPEWNSGS